MKKVMTIAAVALMMAGSTAFACSGCGCSAKKAADLPLKNRGETRMLRNQQPWSNFGNEDFRFGIRRIQISINIGLVENHQNRDCDDENDSKKQVDEWKDFLCK